ncbi:MAG: CCA tRNA nucleotidyltransferase [Nanoarchaeota archaeon]|nr:CCA tRNA nucleotidyltransferase [Nanoarchaeota archaeon]MBU1269495.1 CCA tRNA nucleotidyltransferase [Nanoarchaeota archaeon]MBU1603886.1 CCA tRNA nucleotidyltransferase [Nanoarchaeota archaeon]MBU2443342.1 CCA tRNA nucleotidyltransferase [Nanoarchaeota archaeon]
MKKLLEETRKELRPDKNIIFKVDDTVKKINKLLKEQGIKAECVKGGSIAKGTFLKNDYDADLFVKFDYSLKDEPLSDLLENALKKSFKMERVHGSRDYFQIHDEITIELVPVLKITNYKKALNVTDMSPLHVEYVKKKLKQGQADDIRLAKQFCKSAKVYGAESYIKGFSGHIIDLLIIYYGSFEQLLMQAAVWGERVIIDVEKHLKNPLKELNDSKTQSPLIIVDPVQPDRNAAAAMSREQFEAFKNMCREFLKKPSKEFFKVKNIEKREIENKLKKEEELYFIEAQALKGKKDVVGSKLMKTYEFIKAEIEKNEFEIIKSDWEYKDKGTFYFIIKKEVLPETIILRGPPTSEKEGVDRFKEKHEKTFEKNKRLYAEEQRKYRTIKSLIKDLLKEKYVLERVKKISII